MRRAVVIMVCGLALMAPAGALAAGGFVPSVLGEPGISAAGTPFKFIALPARGNTVVERLSRAGNTVAGRTRLSGPYGVAGAAYDGSTTGLSADGATLVLAGIPTILFPSHTHLVVLDTATLRVEQRITLRGFFTVDAISPTGRWLYLIHYWPTPSTYEVRAYDLAARLLVAKPVVDPREPDEKMQGQPVTRTMSPDGRWAYTLYQRSDEPFIHALDTATRTARCVDLPMLAQADLSRPRLRLARDGTLQIEDGGTLLALMNTRTFVARGPEAAPPPRPKITPRPRDSSLPWPLAIAPVAFLMLVLLALLRWKPVTLSQSHIRGSAQ
jgi:hypothetical protein